MTKTSWTVTVDIEVKAENFEEAWELVSTPFNDGTMKRNQSAWLNFLVGEPQQAKPKNLNKMNPELLKAFKKIGIPVE